MRVLIWVLVLVGAYAFGSFPSAYFIAKRTQGLDIREVGSGNVGSTNAVRTLGPYWGAVVFVIDVLKGVIPALVGFWIGGATMGIIAGLASLVGHVYPVWLDFRGGKGIATGLGISLALFPVIGLTAFVVWGSTLLLTDCVAAASVGAATALISMIIISEQPLVYKIVYLLVVVLVLFKHRSNFSELKK
ncbi:MAG: glycerol-3-phosphate acyltransferase [Clostridiales bacterium]|nr:glycerol-3-phosphate acyltransferase [Clostridiales bacterium]